MKAALFGLAATLIGSQACAESGFAHASALASPAYAAWQISRHEDRAGAYDWIKSGVVAGVSLAALNSAITDPAPDGSDQHAFPSGHSTLAFHSAGMLQRRYGTQVAAPAWLLGVLTAAARVDEDKHDHADVIAGALLGAGSGYFLTESAPQLSVSANRDGLRLDWLWQH